MLAKNLPRTQDTPADHLSQVWKVAQDLFVSYPRSHLVQYVGDRNSQTADVGFLAHFALVHRDDLATIDMQRLSCRCWDGQSRFSGTLSATRVAIISF